ncbi:MAG: RNA polymerase sigma factor [Gammaproteobacteria bacterium]|nr:RNA polymerase sigma factor [Gammaproteobacteria bacterium]
MSAFLDPEVPEELLRAAQAGDLVAHEKLFRRFHKPIFSLAWRMLANRAAAEEVVQDTFVEILRKLGSFRGDSPLGGWIRRIAVNFCLMHLRSAWHVRSVSLSAIGEAEAGLDPARAGGAADLSRALAELPVKSRMVVWLHDVEGLTHKEIGEAMGKTESFSKSQLVRAHKRLRDLLGENREARTCMQVSNSY